GSHPVAVLPLLPVRARLRLDATCLVIGTMVPDFEYFARGERDGEFGHRLSAIGYWAIPVTIISALLYHRIIKWPLLLAAPQWLARRALPLVGAPWPAARLSVGLVASLAVSAALGDLTHLFLD